MLSRFVSEILLWHLCKHVKSVRGLDSVAVTMISYLFLLGHLSYGVPPQLKELQLHSGEPVLFDLWQLLGHAAVHVDCVGVHTLLYSIDPAHIHMAVGNHKSLNGLILRFHFVLTKAPNKHKTAKKILIWYPVNRKKIFPNLHFLNMLSHYCSNIYIKKKNILLKVSKVDYNTQRLTVMLL